MNFNIFLLFFLSLIYEHGSKFPEAGCVRNYVVEEKQKEKNVSLTTRYEVHKNASENFNVNKTIVFSFIFTCFEVRYVQVQIDMKSASAMKYDSEYEY